jgi:hypothetical protein
MSTRPFIQEPVTADNWKDLPKEFNDFLDGIDEARKIAESKEVIDPLYPSYDYDWQVDSDIPLQTAIYYWNSDMELPSAEVIVEEINDALAEAAYDDWVSSAYSY